MSDNDPQSADGDSIKIGDIRNSDAVAAGRQSSSASNHVIVNAQSSDEPNLREMIKMTWLQGLSTQKDLEIVHESIQEIREVNLTTRLTVEHAKQNDDRERVERQKETDQHRADLLQQLHDSSQRIKKIERWVRGWTIVISVLAVIDFALIIELAKRIGWF